VENIATKAYQDPICVQNADVNTLSMGM